MKPSASGAGSPSVSSSWRSPSGFTQAANMRTRPAQMQRAFIGQRLSSSSLIGRIFDPFMEAVWPNATLLPFDLAGGMVAQAEVPNISTTQARVLIIIPNSCNGTGDQVMNTIPETLP